MKTQDTVIVLINEVEVKAVITSFDNDMKLVFVTLDTPIDGETDLVVNEDQVLKIVE